MRVADKRALAEISIDYARREKYKEAARVRQRAYAKESPGSIGVDWSDWSAIWKRDEQYLSFLKVEKFADLKNTNHYITSMKASIFVDYLFDFRDGWSLERHREFCQEQICCPRLDEFLHKMDLEEELRDSVYMSTVKRNIESKMYIATTKNSKANTSQYPYMSYVYKDGEYFLGILKGTSEKEVQRILSGRRIFLKDYDLFQQCHAYGVEKFPKTFQTFQKHKNANSEKYQNWMEQFRSKSGTQ